MRRSLHPFREPELVVFDDNPSTALFVPTNVPPTQPEISVIATLWRVRDWSVW